MGVRKGVSDLFFPRSSHGFHGLWLELKKPRGTLSVEQKKFLKDMTKEGYYSACTYGTLESVNMIKWFFQLR
jgi:hypothetical protein